jgi:hypothetical protein
VRQTAFALQGPGQPAAKLHVHLGCTRLLCGTGQDKTIWIPPGRGQRPRRKTQQASWLVLCFHAQTRLQMYQDIKDALNRNATLLDVSGFRGDDGVVQESDHAIVEGDDQLDTVLSGNGLLLVIQVLHALPVLVFVVAGNGAVHLVDLLELLRNLGQGVVRFV